MNKEFGDFQTPAALVAAVLNSLYSMGTVWTRVLEPTCGQGNFIAGLLNLPNPPREIRAFEIQDTHLESASEIAKRTNSVCVKIEKANLFNVDLRRHLAWEDNGPLLVIGNPPWVTNSELGALESCNLPQKTNLKRLRGIEALTGSSNFDVAEYIWLKLIRELEHERPTIALLCKQSVARNVLQFAAASRLPIARALIRKIDARKYFGAAVDACLFYVEIDSEKGPTYKAQIYSDLFSERPDTTVGVINGKVIANIDSYEQSSFTEGVSSVTWRQGLKHDAAAIMELTYDEVGNFRNKYNEPVAVEPEYIYPLLKSSDLFHDEDRRLNRAVIVPQKRFGEDTSKLELYAPHLWSYLNKHAEAFERRKSSIYKGKPPFTIFGIGEYSFASYKVGVSGMYKTPKFRAIGTMGGRPVMLDDTCYLVACNSPVQAALLTSLLNHPMCLAFIRSVVFSDSKRPVTKKLLSRIDLKILLARVDRQALVSRADRELENLGIDNGRDFEWPLLLEEFVDEAYKNPVIPMLFS